MTMLEELKYCASAYSSFPRLGELCARAAAEIDKLDKEARELRRQNAELESELIAWKNRHKGATADNERISSANHALLNGSGLTHAQIVELTSYVEQYRQRGVQGVWGDLADAIAAMIRQNAKLREALLALRRAPNSTVAREMCDKALAAQPEGGAK